MKFPIPCFIAVLADQASKYFISRFIPLNGQLRIIGDFVKLTFTLNPGAVFGISVGPYYLYVVAIACVVLIIFTLRKKSVLFSVILGGALGNLIDRIRLGAVIDFIDVQIGSFHWPTFNLADSCITVGVIFLLLNMITQRGSTE